MKLTQRSGIFLSLLIVVGGLIYVVFAEALADLWKEDIQQAFLKNKWLLFGIVAAMAACVYWLGYQKDKKPAAETVDADQYDSSFRQLKQNLLDQYKTRLDTKTADRLPINLAAKSTHFGTSAARVDAYFQQLTLESADIATEIGNILDAHRRLLIVGDPGAGKTTILLFAALHILKDETARQLPLILNLATWHRGRDFGDWYVRIIAESYI